MAFRSRSPESDGAALRPARWSGRPAGLTLLRAGLVAVLLALAAVLLHGRADTGCPPAADRPAAPGAPGASAGAADPGGPAGDAGQTGDAGQAGEPGNAGEAGRAGDPGGAGAPAGRGRPLPLPAGSVGVPIRLAEPAALAVLRPGARVDLLATTGSTRPGAGGAVPILLATRALVLDVVGAGAHDGTAALYLALQPQQAERAVGLPEGSRFAVVVRA